MMAYYPVAAIPAKHSNYEDSFYASVLVSCRIKMLAFATTGVVAELRGMCRLYLRYKRRRSEKVLSNKWLLHTTRVLDFSEVGPK